MKTRKPKPLKDRIEHILQDHPMHSKHAQHYASKIARMVQRMIKAAVDAERANWYQQP